MEVGAVKQAFNNEVIHLKKKLNQAKIQVIHKLTRKAKTLTEKKAPEHLKEKLKRKAESAINEVLIIKKIKARDIAKFIITHTGKVNEYLNRPKVDNDKACARLVLHKSLQDKYEFMRNRFGNIPIKDLFMSRQERRKLKKEAKEQQKNKKKGKKGKVNNTAGDWDIEDLEKGNNKDASQNNIGSDDEISGDEGEHSEEEKLTRLFDENASDQDDSENRDEKISNSQTGYKRSDKVMKRADSDNESESNNDDNDSDNDSNNAAMKIDESDNEVESDSNNAAMKIDESDNEVESDSNNETMKSDESDDEDESSSTNEAVKSDKSDDEVESDNNIESTDEQFGKLVKLKPDNKVKPINKSLKNSTELITNKVNPLQKSKLPKSSISKIETNYDAFMTENRKIKVKENKSDKKVKENKNKNLKEKLQNRKFQKDDDDAHVEGRKVVDPFFITATGGNYFSLAEPRQPDEVKEVHKQGNRQERRAAMFGRNFKPRSDFRANNFRSNKFNEGHDRNSGGRTKNDRFSNGKDFNDRNAKFNDRNSKFNDRNSKLNDRFDSKNANDNRNDDKKEEKLHPSWEAKRKLKSMSLLPSQGKKIVFDDN